MQQATYTFRATARHILLFLGSASFAAQLPALGEDSALTVEPMDWALAAPSEIDDAYAYRPVHHNGKNFSLAYYLGHFHRLANAVQMEGENRGFIDAPVWRRSRDNEPYNARIMENITSLAWLYARNEPWNPYYGDEATRRRLEAAMEFWVSIQNDDGRFSEYGEERWNLAATAFATKFISEALIQLEDGPPMDPDIMERVREANRKAILFTLNDDGFWNQAKRFSNQYGNVFAGAIGYLHLYDDAEMASDLKRQMVKALDAFQSPAGYLYEHHGPDWGYYFGTHHSNLHMVWHFGRNKEVDGVNLGDLVAREYEKSTEWLAYNAVPQPDGERFFLNRAAETRQRRASFDRLETPLSEVVPLARAFSLTDDERKQRLAWSRTELENDWENPPQLELRRFSSYSPYAFLHRDHDRWYPTEEERAEAFRNLPYNASDRFTHQRKDDRIGDVYTYVRRPGYYLAFNSGPRDRPRPRRGIGLLWHPRFGSLLQSQSGSDDSAWGTRRLSDDSLREFDDLDAAITIDGRAIEAEAGVRDLAEGLLEIEYDMRDGTKSVRFEDDTISVRVIEGDSDGRGRFMEQIPLLLDNGDDLLVEGNEVRLVRAGVPILEIAFNESETITLTESDSVNGLSLVTVNAQANHELAYSLRIVGEE